MFHIFQQITPSSISYRFSSYTTLNTMASTTQRATTMIARRLPAATFRPLTSFRPTHIARSSIHPQTIRPQARLYHEKVLDHYSSPRNVGSLNKKDMDVGTGLVGAPACGDVMKLQIRVDKDTNRISDVKFKTFGCGSAIASSSYMTTLVQGMTLEEASKVNNTDIASELCLPPVKCMFKHLNYQNLSPEIKVTGALCSGFAWHNMLTSF